MRAASATAVAARTSAAVAEPSTPGTAPTGFRQWCETVLRPAVLS